MIKRKKDPVSRVDEATSRNERNLWFWKEKRISLFALLIGAVAITVGFVITFFAYRSSVESARKHCEMFYLHEVQTISAWIFSHDHHSQSNILKAVEYNWQHSEDRPTDEYLCIIDKDGKLLLHTLYPDTVGNNCGANVIMDDHNLLEYQLVDLIKKQTTYAGCYISSEGKEQIAAFAYIPGRDWLVGVHRSKEVLLSEIRNDTMAILVGMIVVCGLLMPIALIILYIAFDRSLQRRKQIEVQLQKNIEALRQSENKYRTLFSEMADGFALHEIIVDANGQPCDYRFLETNSMFENFTGLDANQIAGKTVLEVLPEIESYWIKTYGEVALSGKSVHFENYSQILEKHYRITAYCPEKNKFAVIFHDITARKQAERALRETEERFRDFFENAAIGNHSFGPDKIFIDINNAELEMIGYKKDEIVGKKTWADLIIPEQKTQFEQHWQGMLTKGEVQELEYTLVHKDGHYVDVVLNASSKFDENGNFICTRGSALNITDRKRAEEKDKQRQAELLHMSRLTTIGEMASGLAHELNQPLSAITSYSTACINTIKSGEFQTETILNDLQMVISQGRRAGEIIHRIREFLKKRTPHRSTVNINDLIENAMGFVANEIKKHQIQLQAELSDQLPVLLADPIQLEQVFLNVVQNAIEAMADLPSRKRLLAVRTRMQEDKTIEIVVRDSGNGISEEVLEKMFDSFFTTKPQGLGMGLSISRTIIEAHNGMIFVRPGKVEGTEIVIQLPVKI